MYLEYPIENKLALKKSSRRRKLNIYEYMQHVSFMDLDLIIFKAFWRQNTIVITDRLLCELGYADKQSILIRFLQANEMIYCVEDSGTLTVTYDTFKLLLTELNTAVTHDLYDVLYYLERLSAMYYEYECIYNERKHGKCVTF